MKNSRLASWKTALPFLLPSLAGFVVFSIIPMIMQIFVSLTSWDGLSELTLFSDFSGFMDRFYVGIENYKEILTSKEFYQVIGNTLEFVILYIPLMLIASMIVALILNSHVKGVGIFRVLYYIPVITSWVAGALIWKWVLSPEYGAINNILALFGIEGPSWLQSSKWAMPAIVLASVWKDMGYFGLTLSFSCTQGLSKLRGKASEPFVLTPFRRAALIDCIALLQNAGGLPDVPRYLLNRLGEAESLLRLFLLEVPTRILYIDYDADGQPTFCAASSRVPQLLRSALWNTREPAILTSGTLAAAGDFSHTEQLLGLTTYRPLRHFRADSPFNYKKKCLLYFPPRVKKRMDNRKMAEEIVRLVGTCHGHALVLFTSYRQMAEVRALTDGQWPYPTYQAWRNGGRVIQQFKESGNGVLFAAGSCWEGIDFPGDMVSLLIIAKLPFPIPDPVSDYERQKYSTLQEYIAVEIIPEMQKKLRQGFGRAIRTEQDSCVVAILDERAGIGGKYHDAALAALPTCPTTEKIEDVQQFIREQKRPDYFL